MRNSAQIYKEIIAFLHILKLQHSSVQFMIRIGSLIAVIQGGYLLVISLFIAFDYNIVKCKSKALF